ncbi:MAG: XRE family transcriptional regulator, partial [Chloroflexi bacterium]
MTYSFGKWLQRRRKAEDLTQKQLAERAFCSLNTIKKIETDQRRPSRQLAQSLGAALRLPPEQVEIFIECARGLRPVDHLAEAMARKGEGGMVALPHRLSPAPLPQPATPLLGREVEMASLTDLLAHSWLVTIIGPGGMGKTRLALAAAHQQQALGRNVVFVSLAELESAAHLATAVAQALGLEPGARLPAEAQILQFLPAQKLLLVLDNFEHLLDGAGLLLTIRQAAPGVMFLVTSREPLQLPGEQLYPLSGLACPLPDSGEEVDRFPAAQLFLQSARRLIPDLAIADPAPLLRLCQLTEGMPLALELAAGWTNTLTLSDIVAELEKSLDILRRSRPGHIGRHHSIRVVFDATWQLLPPAERKAFARLSVFRGGFTRETAAAVAHISLPHLSALTGRRWLALDYGNGRYHIHELLRQYG